MRVRISKSNLGRRFYIIKTYYNTKGIERTLTVENLGSEHEIREKTSRDPLEWAKERAAFLTQQEKEENQDVSFTLSKRKLITKIICIPFSLADHLDDIQARLYQNTLKLGKRKTGIIYYDCTNFFFEMEDAGTSGRGLCGKNAKKYFGFLAANLKNEACKNNRLRSRLLFKL